MTSRPDDEDPAVGTDTLDALAGRLRLVLHRLGRPEVPGLRAAGEPDPALDRLTQQELISLSAQLGRSYLAELDRQLAAGRMLDMGILEQRAG